MRDPDWQSTCSGGVRMKRFGMRIWIGFLLALAIGGAALAQTPSPNDKKTISITWLGHAAFEIVSPGSTNLLIDPFLTKNLATPAENKDLTRYHPSHILVTHSHGDHLGDAVELAKLSKAKVVGVMMFEAAFIERLESSRYIPQPLDRSDL
jgi:glyoxylase-like metal-dependent hydrolase (beta-lactamase superfamily II)